MADNKVRTITIKIDGKDALVDLNEIKKALKDTSDKSKDLKETNLGNFRSQLSGLKDQFVAGEIGAKGLAKGVLGVGKAMIVAFITNPVGIAIAAIGAAILVLYNVFKDFEPLIEKIEQGFAALAAVWETLKTGIVSFVTGNKSLTESFKGMGKAMADAAEEAVNLKKAQQDLDDAQKSLELTNKSLTVEMEKLIIQSKNRSLSEAERLKLIAQADEIETKIFNNRKGQAEEQARIKKGEILLGKNATDLGVKNLEDLTIAQMYALADEGKLNRKKIDDYQATQLALLDIDSQSNQRTERNQNRRDALEDAAKAKRDKAIEDAKKAQEEKQKAIDDEYKSQQDLTKVIEDNINAQADAQQKADEDAISESIDKTNAILKANKDAAAEEFRIRQVVNRDLIDNEANSFEIRREALLNQLAIIADDQKLSDEERIIESRKTGEELANLEKENRDKLAEKIQEGISKVRQFDQDATATALNLQKIKFQQGKISQEQYDKNVAKIQEQAAKREKAYAVSSVIISTIQGVANALATKLPWPIPAALAVVAGALGAVQIAKIISTPTSSATGGGGGSVASAGAGISTTTTAPSTSFNFAPSTNVPQNNTASKTYVIGKEVTSQQQLDRQVISNATI